MFLELTRVKQYFDKIKATENPAPLPVRNMALDKSAAGRFIKAGLVSSYVLLRSCRFQPIAFADISIDRQ